MLASSIPKKDKNSGPSCGGSGSGASSCNEKPKNPGQEPAGLKGGGGHGGPPGSNSCKDFKPANLEPLEIRALLYRCVSEGACDTGPATKGDGKVPKCHST